MNTTKTKLHPSFEILMLQVEIQHRIRQFEQHKAITLQKMRNLVACTPGKTKPELAEIEQENFRLHQAFNLNQVQTQAFITGARRRIKKLSQVKSGS